MIIKSDTSGLDSLRARIMQARNALSGIVTDAAQQAGNAVKSALSDAAPHGQSGGGPPPGDALGPLAGSFSAFAEAQSNASAVCDVSTNQSMKLKYVTEGRGWVYPVVKKALMWKGLDHPVKSARPSKANDFVSPVLDSASDRIEPEMDKAIEEIKDILEGA